MCRTSVWALILLLIPYWSGLVVVPTQAAEQPGRFGELLCRVPAGANTLVMLDVEAVQKSLFVVNTPASEKATLNHLSRYVFGTDQLDRAVLAANLDLNGFIPVWETALVKTNFDVVLADIAQRQNGRVEHLGSMEAVWLPTNGYLVPFTSRLIGMRFPANRPFVAGWANHPALPGQDVLTPYLKQAAAYPENVGTEIIMAMDLENVLDPGAVRQSLEETKAVPNRGVDLDRLSRVLASVRGVTLGVRVGINVTGSLRIDFNEHVSMMESFAKPLILEKLAEFGVSIDEFYGWKVRVAGNTLFLSGNLSASGLRRVLAIVEPPAPDLATGEATGSSAASTDGEVTGKRTYEYYKSLRTLIDDVKDPHPKSLVGTGEVAVWMDRYARKIDQLPILGVDEQLVNFAGVLAQSVRDMAVQYRRVGIEASKMSNNPRVEWNYGYGYGGYGNYWGGYRGGAWAVVEVEKWAPASNITRRLGRAEVAGNRADLWRHIDDDMATARRELTKRYQMEF